MAFEVKLLGPGDDALLSRVAGGVFDDAVRADMTAEFLADPRHHLAVAVDEGVVVGFASAVRYVHPDKAPELWINEVGVAPSHQQRGIAKAVLRALLDLGRSRGCVNAWVLTDRGNAPARALYASLGGVDMPGDMVGVEFDLEGPGA
jgi:ribosomal protein S18 acetylase RimI-like enzyme